jgi:bile acid-coenzyme A ligase
MTEIAELKDIDKHDLTSIKKLVHATSPIPIHIKKKWIDLIGPDHIFELYGSTEATGLTGVWGQEWLDHEGTVGRPIKGTELRVLDSAGRQLEASTIGEIFMRRRDVKGSTYAYIGAVPARQTADGFVSTGDLGWVDPEGYLFLGDRAGDVFVRRRIRIHPNRIERALTDIDGVRDAVVVGVPDGRLDHRIHAIVQLSAGGNVLAEDIRARAMADLPDSHWIDSLELVEEPIRSRESKVNRRELAEAILAQEIASQSEE